MSRDITPFALRMPPDLRELIEQSAKNSGRSLNSEIVGRLQESFRVSVQRPPNPAIYVAEMARDQKLAFIESLDRSMSTSGDQAMLRALREAAMSELEVIDRQIEGKA